MSKDVILKKGNESIFPVTKYENILNAPDLDNIKVQDIYVGDDEPSTDKLWIDTSDNNLERVQTQSDIINSIQTAVYALQQQVSKLMLIRTNGVISGNVTDSTFTEIANSADPVIPDIIAEDEEEYADQIEYPAYAAESEPTVNHVTIKMGTWKEIQSNIRFFINGELVWCTDRSAMYIYVNGTFKKVASSSSSPDEPIIDDDTMDTTELQQYLDKLDHINIVPVNDPNSKYTVRVNEYGNLIVYDANNDTVQATPSSRDLYFQGYKSIGALVINSFYLGGLENNEHSYQPCSHNFVELANISYQDINLNGLCLLYTHTGEVWYKLPLWGVCKAQSTFLIRGAQCSVMDVNTTKLKVKTFDIEWLDDNGNLIKFDRNDNKAMFYLCWCDLNDNNKIYEMNGDANEKVDYPSNINNLFNQDDTGKSAFGYIDLVGIGDSSPFKEKNAYPLPSGTMNENMLFIRRYSLDPVTQSNPQGIVKRNNKKYWEYVTLDGSLQDNVERYTPKASFENKNLSTDKHNFDPNKPNTLTCSFGIQATYKDAQHPATRCFNWNSVGYYDEYLWYKKKTDSEWTRIESYKEGVNYSRNTQEGGLNRPTDPKCILDGYYGYYKRIRWETYYGAPITTHKVMVTGLTSGVYEYKVGRADENGNPTDYISKTREFTVKADSEVTSFDFIQTTDQQGANWDEYQIWDLSADFINRNERINQQPKLANGQYASANTSNFEFTINTGDITYNGSRPNEWIDYYNGYSHIDDKEEMLTIGNNDLAPIPGGLNIPSDPEVYGMTLLGRGDERPNKISHFVADLFYTQEMDPNNLPVFEGVALLSNAPKTYRVPSLYSFNYGQFHFVSLNSEVRTGYADANPESSNYTPSTVTGEFGVKDPYDGSESEFYAKVEDWLVKDLLLWKDGEIPSDYTNFSPHDCQKAIIYTHEMPFTITAAATYATYLNPNKTSSQPRETAKANLNTKHAFRFQRLFKLWGIRLVFGGHKHTCSISMPIYDAPQRYVPYREADVDYDPKTELMRPLTFDATFNPIIQIAKNDTNARWGIDAKIGNALKNFVSYRGHIFNSTDTDVTVNVPESDPVTIEHKSTLESSNAKPLCRYEIVDSISAPTYVMCQATGYKNKSNSDTSDGEEHCQWQRNMVQGGQVNTSNWDEPIDIDPKAQCYPFYTRFHVTQDHIDVNMERVAGIYDPTSKACYWDVNRDMPNGHEAKMNELYRSHWESCTIPLD